MQLYGSECGDNYGMNPFDMGDSGVNVCNGGNGGIGADPGLTVALLATLLRPPK